MSSSPFSSLRRHCCFTTVQLAEKNFRCAKGLISTGEREDFEKALVHLDIALELHPKWEKALELKARALLYLKRFKEVVELLHEFMPCADPVAKHASLTPKGGYLAEKTSLDDAWRRVSLAKFRQKVSSGLMVSREKVQGNQDESSPESSISKLRQKLSPRSSKGDPENRLGWRYLVLGQACCHLGMMEDAMLLLQNGKRTASAASRRFSNGMRDDNFCLDTNIETIHAAEFDLVNHMLANIKLLLRRRAAAEAALEAGLYAESVRHFTKIIENPRSTPPGFIEDCYLHRAIAYQATGRVVDAIADCNRTLALNPRCTKALSVRASLHEMVKSFSECLLDLQQLKMIYEASLRRQQVTVDSPAFRRSSGGQDMSHVTIMGSLDYINSKIMATRRRLCSRTCSLAARTILDLPQHCSMEDVEKAYLLLSLKHSPDKAALFVENCAYQDRSRDMKTVKEEARASALRLSQLIHRAYTKLLSVISEEEAEEQYELRACEAAFKRHHVEKDPSYVCGAPCEGDDVKSPCAAECSDEDGLADSEASSGESEDKSDDGVHVCKGVENQKGSAEESNIVSLDVESKFDAGVGKVDHSDEGLVRDVVNDENIVSEDGFGALVDKACRNSPEEEQEKVIRGCFEEELCNAEGDKDKVIMVVMKALTSFRHSDNVDAKLIRAAINAESNQCSKGELHHLVNSCHGELGNEALADAISHAFSMDNPNLLAHQRWLMNMSETFSWNLPLSQPLSVT